MRGSISIKVESVDICYELTINRNITIVRGDSATGKTTICNMLRDYYNLGTSSGVTVDCIVPVRAMDGASWKDGTIVTVRDSIVFIDENNYFVKSSRFAAAVRASNCYFVIIHRDDLHTLPYSVKEIYKIVSHDVNGKTVNSFETLHNWNLQPRLAQKPTLVATEDAKSGFQLFSSICADYGVACESTKGKSKVRAFIRDNYRDECMLIIVDGAAFGPNIGEILDDISNNMWDKVIVYVPESIEYLLMYTAVLRKEFVDVAYIVGNYNSIIESKSYFSWERFFSEELVRITKGTEYEYKKSNIAPKYLTQVFKQDLLDVLPDKLNLDK